ncbi:hypothetical protein [Desulfobulbus alkaliphilus]|uniref:hypothetical protein n=1 Tax=Desulfobulbus alkaliphilus TaxID=869814 RepID=UPI001964B883|nr:hypothetical protein [Desulfobulbus alkaliphilus]MBM9538037.1 hypothetical protein [Desulfobulbus alkaliphilus]
MNTTTACIFPETFPEEEFLFPLVQVFEVLVYLQPVENGPHSAQDTPFVQELRHSKKLQAYTPLPLGDQREHFLTLAKDIATRGHAYINQLTMLTLAEIHQQKSVESRHSIITALLHGNDDHQEDKEQALLWQARLILNLAETWDQEQRAVEKGLQTIDRRQKALLAELREETETLFSEGTQPIVRELDATLRYRLRAWSRLFFHHPSSRPPELLVTRHEEAMTRLQDMYEKNHDRASQQLAILDLPLAPRSWPMEPAIPGQLYEGCPQLRSFLSALLASTHELQKHNEAVAKHDKQNLEQQWQQQCERQFPARDYGRCRLELSVFPGISPRCLFMESFAGEAPSKKPGTPGAGPKTIVGFLRI